MAMSVSAYRLAGLVCKYGVIVAISCKHLLTKCCSTVQMHRSMPLQKIKNVLRRENSPSPDYTRSGEKENPSPHPPRRPQCLDLASVSKPRRLRQLAPFLDHTLLDTFRHLWLAVAEFGRDPPKPRPIATAVERGEMFCLVSNARFRHFPSANFHI